MDESWHAGQDGHLLAFVHEDSAGAHALRMNNTVGKHTHQTQRLRTAGCDVNTEGQDWPNAGAFYPTTVRFRLTGKRRMRPKRSEIPRLPITITLHLRPHRK
jgi:hypothetical protein